MNNDLEKKFVKIVKELGGKTPVRLLLAKMDQEGNLIKKKLVSEAEKSIASFLRDLGYKIKSEEPSNRGMELEFYTKKAAEAAFEDIKSTEYINNYNIDLYHNILSYEEL